jgi:hypothetical protein
VRNVIFKMNIVGLIVSIWYMPAAVNRYGVDCNALSNSFNVTQLYSFMSESNLLSSVELVDVYSMYDTVCSYMAPDTAQVTPTKVVEIGVFDSVYDAVPDVEYIVMLLMLSTTFLASFQMIRGYRGRVVLGYEVSDLGGRGFFSLFYTESNDAESNDAESNDAEINDAEINDAESNDAEINDAESNDAESNDAESNDAESNDAESNDAESNDAESNDAESNDAESNDAESNDAESNDAESNDTFGTESHEGEAVHNEDNTNNPSTQETCSLGHEKSIQPRCVSPSQPLKALKAPRSHASSTSGQVVPVNANAMQPVDDDSSQAMHQIIEFCPGEAVHNEDNTNNLSTQETNYLLAMQRLQSYSTQNKL